MATLIDNSIKIDQQISEGYDGSKNLLDHFIDTKRGLKALQPTLFWTVKFLNDPYSKEIHFVNSVTIPGESLETEAVDTALYDIRYPLVNRRSTKNQFTIGLFEDIYSTTENIISEQIKRRSLTGGKHTTSTTDIIVVGYMMYGAGIKKWKRVPRIAYQFNNCYPIQIEDYKYDHTNQKWANVRNATFAFRDYHFTFNTGISEVRPSIYPKNPEPKYDAVDLTTEQKAIDLESIVFKNIGESQTKRNASAKEDVIMQADLDKIREGKFDQKQQGEHAKLLPSQAGNISSRMTENQQAAVEIMKISKGGDSTKSQRGPTDKDIPIKSTPYTNDFITEPKINKNPSAPESADIDNDIGFYVSDAAVERMSIYDKPAILKDWKFDTPMKSLERDSLLTTVIKTAVRKFLIPDTPLYNSGHGMAWQPDFMKDVSKAIRKVQQVFYTEPKIKNTPEEDHTTETSHFGANRVAVDPDDTPHTDPFSKEGMIEIPYDDHIINHGPADTVRINPNDFTRINEHGDPNNVNIDPNDHTTLENHGDPNNVNIDPNDHTTLENHGSPNNVNIDPNDHTTLENHDEGNLASIDPNDYTTLGTHGDPNNVNIDPNDHTTHTSHSTPNTVAIDPNDFVDSRADVKANEIPVNPDDRLEQTTAVGNQITIDQNDFADSENIKPNEVPIDKNDTPDAQNIPVNEKTVDEKDYVVSDELKTNDVVIPTNDTPKMDDIETKKVTIDPNDFVSSEHKIANKNIISVPSNDRPNELNHEKADMVLIPKDDTVTKFTMPQNVVSGGYKNDRILHHEEKPDLVVSFGDDTPDTEHISNMITRRRPETSLMDFANMIVNERKNDGQNRITKHENKGNVKDSVPDPLLTHDPSAANILDRSKESSTINTVNRDKGRLVDVHRDDHTEIK